MHSSVLFRNTCFMYAFTLFGNSYAFTLSSSCYWPSDTNIWLQLSIVEIAISCVRIIYYLRLVFFTQLRQFSFMFESTSRRNVVFPSAAFFYLMNMYIPTLLCLYLIHCWTIFTLWGKESMHPENYFRIWSTVTIV